jgi:hypothetical protein
VNGGTIMSGQGMNGQFLRALVFLLLGTTASAGLPTSTRNNDTCDIALLPAATLLLPYFEVDVAARSGSGETTLFTVTNVTNEEQIAHVTIWTDRSYPVLGFNLYLTGYDTQSINLHDVLDGRIAPPNGTAAGRTNGSEYSNPNPALDLLHCDELPSFIPSITLAQMRSALTRGTVSTPSACNDVGDIHPNAVGYVTIDVVGSCGFLTPPDPAYYSSLRFDNVFVGDYQQVNGAMNSAQGGPLVHIRAIPDDGAEVNLPRTFYGRFQNPATPKLDRRQPLPSVFAARWIHTSSHMDTTFKVWRDASRSTGPTCSSYLNYSQMSEVITFDENENAVADHGVCACNAPINLPLSTPNAFRKAVDSGFFPRLFEAGGWMILNLDPPTAEIGQAWVISSMEAEGRYSVDIDATPLGNGCSPAAGVSQFSIRAGTVVGPPPNVNP